MISRFFECVNLAENKNKFYNIHLKKTDTGTFYVLTEFGRIGKTIIAQNKTFGTDFNSAKKVFDKMIKIRLAHKYNEIRSIPIADIPFYRETNEHYQERCREIRAGLNTSLLVGGSELTQRDVDGMRRAGL